MNEKRVLSDFKKPLFISTQRVYDWHGYKSVLCCKGHNAFVMNVPYKIVPQRKTTKTRSIRHFSSCGCYANQFRCRFPQRRGWQCHMQGVGSGKAGNPLVRCCPAKRNVFCLEPAPLNLTRLWLPCRQACWPGCPLPCPGQPGFSWATGGRWMSPSRVCSPGGLLAPGKAAGRRLEKCFCKDPSGCSWGCWTVKCWISS